MSLNKVMLIGNVGKDPEVRYLESNPQSAGANPKVATFPLATSERYRDRSGDVRENTEWHNIVAWRNSADVAEKYIRKGTQVYIEGRTVIIISHSISQIIDSEMVYALQKGRVEQSGHPDDVYRAGGVYKDIIDASARSLNIEKIAKTVSGS